MRGGRVLVLTFAPVLACGHPTPNTTSFDLVTPTSDEGAIVVASATAEARAELLAALDAHDGAPAVHGRAPWSTVAIVDDGNALAALEDGRTFARIGTGDLHLDVRVGAGSVSAAAGGTVVTSAERALIEVRVEDPSTRDATFRLEIHADERAGGMPPVDVTPAYLRRALPRGRYRAFMGVPRGGARWLVGVTVLDGSGDAVGHGWASAVAMRRP